MQQLSVDEIESVDLSTYFPVFTAKLADLRIEADEALGVGGSQFAGFIWKFLCLTFYKENVLQSRDPAMKRFVFCLYIDKIDPTEQIVTIFIIWTCRDGN